MKGKHPTERELSNHAKGLIICVHILYKICTVSLVFSS